MARFRTGDVNQTRTRIAFTVIALSFVGIAAIATAALWAAGDKAETSRLVFTSVLPLLGTWVGGVLAFYFSRDNLQTGSDTAFQAIREARGTAAETPVSQVMIRMERITLKEEVDTDAEALSRSLKDLYAKMRSAKLSRVPVFTRSGVALYVVHEPDIDKYAQLKGVSATELPDDETLTAMRSQKEIWLDVTSFTSVHSSATVADARAAVRRTPHCKDVFVTEGGQKTDRVLGWITNSDLAITE